MKRWRPSLWLPLAVVIVLLAAGSAWAVERFPPPDFDANARSVIFQLLGTL